MENPKVRYINNKESIMKYVESNQYYHSEDIERDKYMSALILPGIESFYGKPSEMYSYSGIELLQREIELFKKVINYDSVCQEIDDDMRRCRIKK